MRPNFLHPPFDNVKLRRAILPALNQADFMNAALGGDPQLSRTGVGVFTPGSPLANDAGLEVLTGPRDLELARKLVAQSGYANEKVVFIAATDYPILFAEAQVGADLLTKLGLKVEFQSMDWGTMVQRRANKNPVDQGGWSVFCTGWEGLNLVDPSAHYPISGTGLKGWFGWYKSDKMEALRTAWFNAPDLATQKQIARQIQLLVWDECRTTRWANGSSRSSAAPPCRASSRRRSPCSGMREKCEAERLGGWRDFGITDVTAALAPSAA